MKRALTVRYKVQLAWKVNDFSIQVSMLSPNFVLSGEIRFATVSAFLIHFDGKQEDEEEKEAQAQAQEQEQ